jgi:16S rRNA (cytidine1402-2'-O)-methyltransferase
MAAISSSGLPAGDFTFLGFPPSRPKDRKSWLERVAGEPRLVVFFEAPHRIRQTLEALAELVGPARLIGIGRELTKAHEELVIRPIDDVLSALGDPRGEFTVLVTPAAKTDATTKPPPDIEALRVELGRLIDIEHHRRRPALKILAERHGLAVNDLYRLLEDPIISRRVP